MHIRLSQKTPLLPCKVKNDRSKTGSGIITLLCATIQNTLVAIQIAVCDTTTHIRLGNQTHHSDTESDMYTEENL